MTPIQLQAFPHQTQNGLPYQHLRIQITQVDGILEPQDLKGLALPTLPWNQGVIIEGKAPIWVYGYLVHECHPAQWVACYDPRLGAIVVSTHVRAVKVGEVLDIILPEAP